MGACYSVEYMLYPKNEKECEKALQEYVNRNGRLGEANQKQMNMDELIRFVLCADRAGSNYEKISSHHYSSSFDASYGWERVLADAFIAMTPCLEDGSYVSIEPDEYPYSITLRNGQCIDGRASETRMLQVYDIPSVKELDEQSGFQVARALEEYVKSSREPEDSFGIFYEEELIGYCSLADPDDSMEIPPDAKILTEMFVKSEWRDMLFGNQLIMEAMENLEEDCYVVISCEEQRSFYEAAGFEKVSGNDELMVRYV